MKIAFKILKVDSGSDLYFERLSDRLKKSDIKTEVIYYHKFFEFFPFLLKFINKKVDCDIIHSSLEYGWAFKENNKPLIITVFHSVFDNSYKEYTNLLQKIFHYFILKPNIKKSLKMADKIIAISQYSKKNIIHKFGDFSIDVVYPYINNRKFKLKKIYSTDNRFKLLFVGNLIKRKGSDLLPKIMKLLGNDYVLYYTSGLRTRPPNNFNLPNMIPLGKLTEKELINKYNQCDVLLAPSRLEGFGYQIAEAMACGKPIITTNCSSLPELVINHKGGFLCEIDNVSDFVEKIKTLSKNKYLMKKMGQFNRRRIVEKFNLREMGKEYQQLYDELLRS